MNFASLLILREAQTVEADVDDLPASAGGGRAAERDLALAVALVATAAAVVLVLTGAWPSW
jgi:hypothetical protein